MSRAGIIACCLAIGGSGFIIAALLRSWTGVTIGLGMAGLAVWFWERRDAGPNDDEPWGFA